MIHMNKGDSQENIAKILIPKLNASDAKQRYDVLQIHNIEADLFFLWRKGLNVVIVVANLPQDVHARRENHHFLAGCWLIAELNIIQEHFCQELTQWVNECTFFFQLSGLRVWAPGGIILQAVGSGGRARPRAADAKRTPGRQKQSTRWRSGSRACPKVANAAPVQRADWTKRH